MTEERDEFYNITVEEALEKLIIRSVTVPTYLSDGKELSEYHIYLETDMTDEYSKEGHKLLFGFYHAPGGSEAGGGWHLFSAHNWLEDVAYLEQWDMEVEPLKDVTYDAPRPLREVLLHPVERYGDLLATGSEDDDEDDWDDEDDDE